MFVLVSGLEDSGTTTAARVLAEVSGSLGIPTNWKVSDLSRSAQQRHQCLRGDLVSKFNRLTRTLWYDDSKQYILHGRDERGSSSRMQLLESAANVLREQIDSCALNGSRPEVVVYHRSMPFITLSQTPFLHDLPILAGHLGWSSNVLLSLRDIPDIKQKTIRSLEQNTPFIAHIEPLLNASNYSRPTFVRYDDLVNNHQLYTACMSRLLATWKAPSMFQTWQSQLLQSPQLHLPPRSSSQLSNRTLSNRTRAWVQMSHNYPLLLAATRPGATQCP